jgi:fatty-acid desaturase
MYLYKNINIYNDKLIFFRIIMKHIFILYAFGIVDLHIIIYTLGKSLQSLTCMKNYAQHIIGRREYNRIDMCTWLVGIQMITACKYPNGLN